MLVVMHGVKKQDCFGHIGCVSGCLGNPKIPLPLPLPLPNGAGTELEIQMTLVLHLSLSEYQWSVPHVLLTLLRRLRGGFMAWGGWDKQHI